MDKRGQTTVFVVLGIVILAVAVLLFYLRGQVFFGPVTPETLGDRLVPIEKHIKDCVEKVGDEPIRRIGLQGGYLKVSEDTYRLYDANTVSYLCYNRENDPRCYNRMLIRGDMEKEISEAIGKGLNICLNIKKFERGFDLQIGRMSVDTEVGDYNTIVTVNLPLRLEKKDVVIEEDTFSETFNYPLGKLYSVSQDIVNVETEVGEFEQLSYMLVNKGKVVIDKKKPYPDKLYILKHKDSDYIFQFYVEGEPTT